jgi:hypothetical protein
MSTFESTHIHKKTQKAIFEKISALNRQTLGTDTKENFYSANNTILESKKNPISQHIARSCFARFSVDVPVINENDDEKKTDLIATNISSFISGGRLGGSKQANRPLTFNDSPFNVDENYTWRGETGLTNIQVTQKSFFVNEITISYTCPDPVEFEKTVKPKFLQLGRFAVIEFGWGTDEDSFTAETPEQTMNTLAKLQQNLQTFNERYSGNYQIFCGDITNYTFKVDENGYYSGTITIVSRGNNVLHSTIDNESTEDKPIADFKVLRNKEQIKKSYGDTKDLKKVFKNFDEIKENLNKNEITFKAVIDRLEDVVDIYLSGEGIAEIDFGDAFRGIGQVLKTTLTAQWQALRTGGLFIKEWFDDNGEPTKKLMELDKFAKRKVYNELLETLYRLEETATFGVPQDGRAEAYETIELVEDKLNPLVEQLRTLDSAATEIITIGVVDLEKKDSAVKTKFFNGAMEYGAFEKLTNNLNREITYPIGINDEKNKSRFLVSWGWFEDHILNSFFQLRTDYKNLKSNKTISKELQSFRSVHKPLLYEVPENERINMTTKNGQNKDLSPTTPVDLDTSYSNRCNNSPQLQSIGLSSVILPGQTETGALKEYREKFGDAFWSLDLGSTEDKHEAERLLKVFQSIDDKFKPFGKPEENYGYIRNMVFDVKYLKSHFQNITSVQDGIRSLFSDVNTKYGGYFNFMLKQDDNNTGRIGVTDGYYMNPTEKNEELLSEDNTNDWLKWIESDKELSSEKMFRFDLYTKNTIIKEFDLSLNLTDKAATMAYFNNIDNFVGGSYYNPNQIKDLSIERFTALTDAELKGKQYSSADEGKKLSTKKEGNENFILNKVRIPVYGSDGIGLASLPGTYDKNKESESPELFDDKGINFTQSATIKKSIKEIQNRIKKKENESKLDKINEQNKPEPTEPAPTPYSEIGELDPFLQGVMKNNVNHNRDAEAKSNYKLLKTIIPIDLNMTIDGVGGLMPGNLFRVDYLPEMYRKYCYFQIFTVSHQINTSGWSTSITAKMKLDFPKLYKEKILVIDDIDESTPDLSEEEKEMIEETIAEDIPMETVEAESTSVNVDVDIDSLEELPEDFQEMSNEETLDYLGIGSSN